MQMVYLIINNKLIQREKEREREGSVKRVCYKFRIVIIIIISQDRQKRNIRNYDITIYMIQYNTKFQMFFYNLPTIYFRSIIFYTKTSIYIVLFEVNYNYSLKTLFCLDKTHKSTSQRITKSKTRYISLSGPSSLKLGNRIPKVLSLLSPSLHELVLHR